MARRILGLAIFFLGAGFFTVVPALGQQKGQPPADMNEIDSDKLNVGTFVGRLKGGVSPGEDFELEIEYKRAELNPKALQGGGQQVQQLLQAQQQIAQAQAALARARNPQEQARAMNQMQRTMQRLQLNQLRQATGAGQFKMVTDTKDIAFHAAGDVVIRRATPPVTGFDEKGNVKVPSPAELKAMKGPNPRLPGYEGKAEDLKAGSVVSVVMKRVVADPKAVEKPEHKNEVTMIILEQEASSGPMKGKKN